MSINDTPATRSGRHTGAERLSEENEMLRAELWRGHDRVADRILLMETRIVKALQEFTDLNNRRTAEIESELARLSRPDGNAGESPD